MKCNKNVIKSKNAVTLDAGGMGCFMTGAMGRAPSYKYKLMQIQIKMMQIQKDVNTKTN